jgi:hypothetical protein
MRVTKWDEAVSLVDGAYVEVEGRYEPCQLEMRPPGEEIVTVQVVLADGYRLLIGAYRTPECVRPAQERGALAGKRVRVVGTFRHTAPWPEGAPVPGLWTGGGPQIVTIQRLEPID